MLGILSVACNYTYTRKRDTSLANWKTYSVCLKVTIPTDPVELSFWVAMNLPIDDAQRLKVLQMDCAVPRLRMELGLLKKVNEKPLSLAFRILKSSKPFTLCVLF